MSEERRPRSDRRSDISHARRGRPSTPPLLLLRAADAVFAGSDAPLLVTMDEVAAAAGVGKGTLFRVFGSRDALLDALWGWKLGGLRERVSSGRGALAPEAPAGERIVGLLDALLLFKMENRHLLRARELAPGLLRSEHYLWMHGLLRELLAAVAGETRDDARYGAHALLAALHIDLVEDLLARGLSLDAIRRAQADHVRAVVAGVDRRHMPR